MSPCSGRWRCKCEVAQEVNGPLLEMLAAAVQHQDKDCVNLFRKGAPLAGILPISGNGAPVMIKESVDVAKLRRNSLGTNRRILEALRDDPYSAALHNVSLVVCPLWHVGSFCMRLPEACLEDAMLGRMSFPEPATPGDCEDVIISPRFGVEQGHHTAQAE